MKFYDPDVMSDQQVLSAMAGRLREERLQRNLTQQHLADAAGIGVATLRRFEGSGGNLSLLNLIALLRALNLLPLLDALLHGGEISPVASLRDKGAGIYPDSPARQRARPAASESDSGEWRWGDES